MNRYLSGLVEERTALSSALETLTNRAATEGRDLTDSERTEAERIQTRAAEIDGSLSLFADSQESNRRYADLMGRIESRGQREAERTEASVSWGEVFTSSPECRSYRGRGTSGQVDVPFDTRALVTTADILPANIHRGFSPVQAVERFPLLAAVYKETTSSGAVEWTEIGFTSAAAVVAEGELKPEAGVTFTDKSEALDTLAHWVPITRQAAEDYPRLQSIIEGRLRNGLLKKIEADIATAIGAATLATATSDTLLKAIRVGIGDLESLGYFANGVLLNPADYALLDIDAMGVTSEIARRGAFWGLTPIASNGVAAGTAIVGDMDAVTLFQRGSASVYMTDSHSDYFVRNKLVVLAETRVKSAVTEPAALVEVSVTP